MALYPLVKPGDPFKPSAALSNDVRQLINGIQNFSAGKSGAQYFGPVRIHVWNSGSETIRAGTFVVPDSAGTFNAGLVPVTTGESSTLKVWYADSEMKPGDAGECVVRGPLTVKAEGKGDCAMPVINGDYVTLGSTGFPVLFAADGQALIHLTEIYDGYEGSFPVTMEDSKLKVGSGYLSRNGRIELIPGTASGIVPQTGILCITSKISGNAWTKPEFGFSAVDSTSYPLAEITVRDDLVDIRQLPVSVAVILETKPCPLIRKS